MLPFDAGEKLNEEQMTDLRKFIKTNQPKGADAEIMKLVRLRKPEINVEPIFQNSLYVNPQAVKVRHKSP